MKKVETRKRVSLPNISDAAETISMRTIGLSIIFQQLTEEANLPCIVHCKQNHKAI